MESIAIKYFQIIFDSVRILLFCGLMAGVLSGLQKAAFHSKQVSLISMLQTNLQLVGKTK